jgi:hypothetical protein
MRKHAARPRGRPIQITANSQRRLLKSLVSRIRRDPQTATTLTPKPAAGCGSTISLRFSTWGDS